MQKRQTKDFYFNAAYYRSRILITLHKKGARGHLAYALRGKGLFASHPEDRPEWQAKGGPGPGEPMSKASNL